MQLITVYLLLLLFSSFQLQLFLLFFENNCDCTPVRAVLALNRMREKCPNLKYIGVLATGYNIVDTITAKERNIIVTNIPTYGTVAVGQYAIALLLEICHHIGEHSRAVKNGDWAASKDWSFWNYPLIELEGKTMGIIGYGRIGQKTGQIAQAIIF